MDKVRFFLTPIVRPPRTAKRNACDQIITSLNGSITIAPEAIRSNERRAGVAPDATVCSPSQEPSLVEGESSREMQPQKVNGYTVTVNWIPLPAEEQQARRAEMARIVAQSIMRLRRHD